MDAKFLEELEKELANPTEDATPTKSTQTAAPGAFSLNSFVEKNWRLIVILLGLAILFFLYKLSKK
jgi:hypothetical protein